MFKKLGKLLLSTMLVLSLVGCSSGFKAGTFSGSARGFSSDINVELTLDENKTITNVVVVSSAESADIGEVALPKLVEAVLASNTTAVDTITTATVTSEAFIEACNKALAEAGLKPADLKAKESQDIVKGNETLETDIVIIGAGGAGLSAAISAAQAGKSVIIVEKAPMAGGNSSRATGGMNAAKTSFQDENAFGSDAAVEKTIANAKATYPELAALISSVEKQYNDYKANPVGYFDSVELFMLDTLVGGKNVNSYALVETLARNSASAIDWLAGIGANLTSVSSFGGASVNRIHRPLDENGKVISVGSYIVPILEQTAKDLGVTIMYETTAVAINKDSDTNTVSGIVANNATNDYVINADAVIVAAGGFAGNLAMVVEYKAELDGFITTNAPTITGDGIKMAAAINANLVDMEQIQIHPTVHQETSALITEGLRGDGAILVNQEGLRFTDEVGTRDDVSAAELAQTGGYAYLIIDQKMVDASSVIAGYINKGYTVEGGTIEELAAAIGADATNLATTIEKWNGFVAAKKDADFNRTSFKNPLDTAPYYAIKIAPGVHHTMGGIEINTNAEVIDTNGNVINGLFAAGEVTGGVHGANRLGGNAVADFVVYGRIAGESAAKYSK